MRLPLLIGAGAKTSAGGGRVRLHEGLWKIVLDGVKTSKLAIQHGSPLTLGVACEEGKIVQGPTTVNVFFLERGSELSVSVFAELQ